MVADSDNPDDGDGQGADTLDLTAVALEGQAAVQLFTPSTADYDPAQDREKVRGRIALILVFLLLGIVAVSFVAIWFKMAPLTDVKGILELVLAPVVGLVGAVTGFYYGEKSKQ